MKHLGSALLLGILLAMVFVLLFWGRSPQPGGIQGKSPFNRTLT